jgi:hypothetical protein
MRLPPLICGAYAGAYAGEQIAEEHMRHIVARPILAWLLLLNPMIQSINE